MAITKLYYFTNPYYPSYIEEVITKSVKSEVFKQIIKTKKRLKYILEDNNKKEIINSLIKKSKEKINLNLYKHTVYKIDLEMNTFFINDILNIVESYPSKVGKETFTIIIAPPELRFISRGKNPLVSPIELKEEEEMFQKLLEIKNGVIENISQYILFDYWITEIDNLKQIVKGVNQTKKSFEIKESKKKEKIDLNRYPNIFYNNGFVLFNHLLENYVNKSRGRYSDIAFYYWKMFNDKFIHQKSEPFKVWFSGTYEEEFSKIKTLNAVKNNHRLKHYTDASDWFKHQK